jgi:hypothetical protein
VVASTAQPMRAATHFHAFCAVHKLVCSNNYGHSLLALRALIDAHVSWLIDSNEQNNSALQETDIFYFCCSGGEGGCHGLGLVVDFYAHKFVNTSKNR